MKKLILFTLLMFVLAGFAFGGTNVPPCDPNNSPPNCTDYFGVANWAVSPLPAGAITSFTIVSAGSGYSSSTVLVITDMNGTGASSPALTLDASGAITAVSGGGGGTNYIAPQVSVVDYGPGGTAASPTCGVTPALPACGSGAMIAANIGAPLLAGSGIRKFKDTLTLPFANLQIATADTTTFPGSDYYVIGLQQYTAKMHTDLPPTTLRGYCQLNNPASPGVCTPSYLGPTILATKNRPVRVLFKNLLPTGSGGNLFIPVDTTYMGAGTNMNDPAMASYTENRATLHLHGGATPWISDGTPHQWTAPAGETGPARGDSVQLVPDMWFDANGNVIASCSGQGTCGVAGATNDPGPGNLTFFWSNQQGGRLMFYHDHAYGLTRLNVYAGEAAGYLILDPAEETALAAATVPGTVTAAGADVNHLVPLVIQDKTFVATAPEMAAEDPTWFAGGWGTKPGTANPGDLWFPHVYVPNQNPSDPGGSNAFGRWDYGPWTLPGNQTLLLAANPQSAVTVPCTSSAFPNQAVECPIIPNPSGTPEGFMDTPLVNGLAYPVLNVNPEAYRFRILSAGNDRSFNLQWYVADPTVTTVDGRTNTEVKMVPAQQPAAGSSLPLCSTLTPITNTSLFMGLATAVLDGSGNPINGTGLPANCWPNFGAGNQAAGIPVQQTMWAADGRAGGAPDPTTAGPPFIQIGTEGGLLPAPVVIPSMPTGYEANPRSVTITNVSVHGLWLGPAERADVIVDFSKFAGKTLILYNDAPTPAPAGDSRVDYYTGDGDQSIIGGAPNTLAGYGPNTRTIMQVVVGTTPSATATPFSLSTLTAALPNIFAQTQPPIIVPEPTYPSASGGYSPTVTYSKITDANLTFFPIGSTTPVTITDERKTIQELFTLDYGRMNATLGVELPLTNFLTQTTIPLGYIDPITEVINQGDTQLWHITHNGVDTHFIHFHLFNVQVINRSAWDGTVRPPDQNELGWKDTVRMNPLEDILVALKPITPVLPFPLRDSYRLMDVTMPAGSDCPAPAAGASPLPCSIFTDVDPVTNNPLNTPNEVRDFGWEYVWHCHILGHEENDMMRAIAFQVPPEAPSNLTITAAVAPATGLNLSWTDNSASETGFTLQRDNTASFTNPTSITGVGPSTPTDAYGQGITWGTTITFNDPNPGPAPYFYRVHAIKPDATYWNNSGLPITSAWSNTASLGGVAASVNPSALAFGTVAVGSTSLPQTVTLTNAGSSALNYTLTFAGIDYSVATDTCAGTVAANSSCAIAVIFTPSVATLESASLSITTTDPVNPTFNVALTGTGGTQPLLTIIANNTTMRYGAKVPILSVGYSPANPTGLTTLPTCTTTATSTSPVGMYPITCSGAVDALYTITYVAGTVSVTPAPLTIWGSSASVAVGTAPIPPITPLYVGLVALDTPANFTIAPTCTTTATSTSNIGKYPTSCTGAVNPNYKISYAPGTITIVQGLLTVTAPSPTMTYGGTVPPLAPTYSVSPVIGAFTAPTCTTTATSTSNVGSYPITCSGAVASNYVISYVAGSLTISPAAASVTPNAATKVYGTADPAFTGSLMGFLPADNVTATYTRTAGETVLGGPYTISATLVPAAVLSNYTITYNTAPFTITAANASVTPNVASKVYGTLDPAFTGTLTGFLPTDGVTATYTRTAGETVLGSPYTISATLAPVSVLSNYNITYNTAVFTITPAAASVAPNAATKVYGTLDPAFTGTLTGFLPTDGVTATYTRTPGETVAGSPYTISATLAPASVLSNYNVTYATAVFTITPAAASVTPNAATKVYGTLDPALSGTLTGFLAADNVTATYTRTPGETVAGSPYAISATLAPAAVLSNYTVTYNTAAFTITPAAASVTPNAATKAYGTLDPAFTGTLTGFLPADNVTATYTRTAGETVAGSPYAISATLAPATALSNYTITYNTANFTITAVSLTVTASSSSMTYGGAVPAITPSFTGFVNGDTAASLTIAPACLTAATPTSPVGTYASSCSGAVDPNYTITYVPGTVTVTVASLTVTASSASITYGGAVPVIAPLYAGFVNGQTASVLTAQPVCAVATGPYTVAGSPYVTACSGAAAVNYTINYVAGSMTVAQKLASVTPNPASKTYGQADPVFTGALVGFLPADGVTATYSRNAGSNAGTYTISAALAPAAVLGNYSITYNTAVFTINKATSTTTVTAHTPSPSNINQAVTVSFRVTPQFAGTVATGNVMVTASTGESCTGALGATGTGSCLVTFLTSGLRTMTASYAGDVNFLTSVSAAVSHVVTSPIASISPTSLVFGNQLINTNSATQITTLANTGNGVLNISGITITGPNASFFTRVAGGCGATLAVGRTCNITVRFRPTAVGVASATLNVNSNDPVNPTLPVALTGTGVAPAVTLSPTSLAFGTQKSGTTSASQIVTLTNGGTANLTFTSIRLAGTNPNQFAQTNNCPALLGTLAPGASCTITVTFHPTAIAARTATLTITDNAPASPQRVTLTGTGN